jgi:hypothetical protein
MHTSRRMLPALAGVLVSLLSLSGAALATANQPSTVTVRVEGLNATKLSATQVTTTSEPVVKDGIPEHACSGTSAVGALQLATGGNWGGPWNGEFKQYEIYAIEGEDHPFEKGASANYYWSFWLDEKEASAGACEAELQPGDRVLFFPACFGTACPPGSTSPTPLGIEAPASANVGESVPVMVKMYNAKGEASPAVGATVAGGATTGMTDSGGHATISFPSAGEFTLRASASESVRDETTICVHNGNDGNCGTTLTSGGGSTKSTTPGAPQTTVSYSAKVTGVQNGHVYSRRSAPRLLAGVVDVPVGGTLRQVRISLQRRFHGRCFDFSGPRESFVRTRKCGSADFFSVGGSESFSYLLPERLPKGSYTYDIEAINSAGQATKLVSGISHVVFEVK